MRHKLFRLFSLVIVQLSDAIKVHKSLRNEQTEAKANRQKEVEGVEEKMRLWFVQQTVFLVV